jgi:hypothetical protein
MIAKDIPMGSFFVDKRMTRLFKVRGLQNEEISKDGYIYCLNLDHPDAYYFIEQDEEVYI